jgi:hypothetical protein
MFIINLPIDILYVVLLFNFDPGGARRKEREEAKNRVKICLVKVIILSRGVLVKF